VLISTSRSTGTPNAVSAQQSDLLRPSMKQLTKFLRILANFLLHLADAATALNQYPFRIVFRDQPDRLVIIALAHAKRRPGYWHERT